jgi:hypothetical protein
VACLAIFDIRADLHVPLSGFNGELSPYTAIWRRCKQGNRTFCGSMIKKV